MDQINACFPKTGVWADFESHSDGNATRLFTEEFGSDASLSVISNWAASNDTTGFGHELLTDSGVDVEGQIGSVVGTGNGRNLTAFGIEVEVGIDPKESTQSSLGSLGYVVISPDSDANGILLLLTGWFMWVVVRRPHWRQAR